MMYKVCMYDLRGFMFGHKTFSCKDKAQAYKKKFKTIETRLELVRNGKEIVQGGDSPIHTCKCCAGW